MNRSVDRAIDIIELATQNRGGVSLRDILIKTGMPKSSAFDIVRSLVKRNILREIPGKTTLYAPGRQLYFMGNSYPESLPILKILIDRLQETAEATHYNTYAGVLENDELVYAYKYKPKKSILTAAGLGDKKPLHCTALGKVLVSFQKPDECRRLIASLPLSRLTNYTITDREEFSREIQECFDRGYALDIRENDDHTFCVSAPVLNNEGVAEMAVSLSYIYSENISLEKEIKIIRDIAHELSQTLGYSGPRPGKKQGEE
ncbi:MAG: hypothetical protein CVV44_19425 [Spirochaetae bacterium HGW-Spirochaetae-1]|jgi:DNA-binding IclR family transcriptional regulator|nr:MAG: hypothetical protein CVV44_19425 [Spirochaetae bacterium HGW-Spirochaetae-1]